ncbi:MAG TPA: hypothetical protein VIK18_16120 [Pirellulales bacterium]
MALTQAQKALVEKTRSVGTAREAESLSDDDCVFLVATIARDLGLLGAFPELPHAFPTFFQAGINQRPRLGDFHFLQLFERLVSENGDSDSFFACLGTLYKARLKYANILRRQSVPTMDQVGPRGLLQYGALSPEALTAFLLWRKWIFDIDNRAGQETGYLFEPIMAAAIGGTPVSATKSPVRRTRDQRKGRQIDCLKERLAYEIKIRVTIAASGQGRWSEELDFPNDCVKSGYTPLLVVLDSTPNPKLDELKRVFRASGGRVFIGAAAWQHLEREAGPTMAQFLESYVRKPIEDLLVALPEELPEITLSMDGSSFTVRVGAETFTIGRAPELPSDDDAEIPEDVDEQMPGV